MSNCFSSDWFGFISNFFWLFEAIPYIHLLLVMNVKIVKSFFKNIWKALDLEKAENRLREFFQNPTFCDKKYTIDRWGFFFLFVVLLTIIFLIIEITTTTAQTVVSLAFAGFSCYPPLFGCIYVLFLCIPMYRTGIEPEIVENTSDDEEDDKKQVKKWQLYFDPSQTIIQYEFIDFINDSYVNDYRYLCFSRKIIPSFFITAIFIEYIANIIYSFAVNSNRDYSDIGFFIVRIIYSFYSYRFLIVFNVVNFIMNFWQIKIKHKFIWLTYIISIVIAGLILVAAGLGFLIIFSVFKPIQLNNFQYSPAFENVSFGQQSSICQTKFYDFNLLEYIGIALLGQTKNDTIAAEIIKMVFNNQTLPIIPIDNPISHMYMIQINESFYIRSFESLIEKTSFSFIFDLFMNDIAIDKISHGVIPFYKIANSIFLYRYLYFLSMLMNRYLLMDIIRNFAVFVNNLYDEFDKIYFINSTIINVGHSIGGLIAKSYGSKRSVASVAFESLNYYHSLFHMSVNLITNVDFSLEKLKILNVYSPSQLFSEAEEAAPHNIVLPQWRKIYQLTSSYDTFCMIVAGCATDTRYDQFCNTVIGRDNFLNLFKEWNRSRSEN